MGANLSVGGPVLRRAGLTLIATVVAACGDADGRTPPEGGGASAAGPAAPPGGNDADVRVGGVVGHYDLGDYFITGEVVNGLDVPIYGVELDVVYHGAGGAELARDEAAAVLTRIEPGGTAPLADTHYGAPEGIQSQTVTVRSFSREGTLDHRPLAISGVRVRQGITGAVVTGQARNESGEPLSSVKLVTSFRNRAGEVSGVFFDYPVIGTMSPGRTVSFTVETMDDSVAGDSVVVQGEGSAGP